MKANRTPDREQSKQIESLTKQLSDNNWLDRAKAAISLGRLGQPEAVPALICALGDDHYLVGYHAADALKQIATPQAETAIKQWEQKVD